MTPMEVKEALQALKAEMGGSAAINAHIDGEARNGRGAIFFMAHPNGHGVGKETIFFYADNWAAGIEALRATWAEASERLRAERVRRMALAIIRITAEQGVCTDAALRADDFTAEEVARYSAEAVEDANAIASNGPFAVTRLAGANAA